jgi:hypothetical protein
MRVLFLAAAFLPLILTVHAQRQTSQYMCQVSHKHSDRTFSLSVPQKKMVEVGGWKLEAQIENLDNMLVLSLKRIINILGAHYQKEVIEEYPLDARTLPIELTHQFGGNTDVFNMTCFLRH